MKEHIGGLEVVLPGKRLNYIAPFPFFHPMVSGLLIVLMTLSCMSEALAAKETVKIGILAKRGAAQCLKQWSSTAEYLGRHLPEHSFEIVPIDFDHISPMVENRKVDFILANSSFYVELEIKYGVNRIATLKNKRLNGTHTTFGGVVFCRRERSDLRSYAALKGKKFMAVKNTSFGGWRMAWRELKEAGLDPAKDFSTLTFGGTHDAVVYAVQAGKVDAGTVRTDTLERMQLEGKISLDDFHVIHQHGGGKAHLSFLHSTRAYPEWPIAKVRHTPAVLAEKIAIKLIEMPSDSPAAIAATCSGWTIPMNYQSVHDCLKYLRVGPYKNEGKITIRDVINKYWPILLLALIIFLLMTFSIGVFVRLNRNIRAASRDLSLEVEGHQHTARLLREAKTEADRANQAKGMFLANMSHEIRTPMNAIIGMSHLCLGTALKPKQRSYVEKVHQSAKLLLDIINDILDFSKIEAGKLDLERIPFHLDKVLENLSDLVSFNAQKKGLELIFNVAPDTPVNLVGDPLRLGQILLNITGNSVKFTESGEIVITIRPEALGKRDALLKFSVRDTGVGMAPEQVDKLFQSFSQADSSTTRKFGGTGLGLSISKHLVQLMGGDIRVKSESGQGSNFIFTVRLGLDKQAGKEIGLPLNLENLRVLVVDDVAAARKTFAETLSSFSFRVTCVDSGQTALQALEEAAGKDPYRLVLMDYMMPGLDGIETSRLIKDSPLLDKTITLIMVTAYGHNEEIMQQAKEVGLEGFLIKPVTPSSLLDAIMGAVGQQGGLRQKSSSEDRWKIKTLDSIKGARILLTEDNKINQKVALGLLTQAGLAVTIAENGLQAVEMAEREAFQAILMDIQMPVMDGYEATRAIGQRLGPDHPPIIAMTANAMAGDRKKCLQAGMVDHVAKPIEPKLLFDTLLKWVTSENRQPSPDASTAPNEQSPASALPETLANIDIPTGLHHTGGNAVLYRDLLDDFVRDHSDDGLMIGRAIKKGVPEKAHRMAHSLKGVAGGLGAQRLFESTQKVEAELKKGRMQAAMPWLEEMTIELDKVVGELQDRLPPKPAADDLAAHPDPLDPDELSSLLNEFAQLANDFDPEAENLAKQIVARLEPVGGRKTELAASMAEQTADIDFDKALETLETLRKELGL